MLCNKHVTYDIYRVAQKTLDTACLLLNIACQVVFAGTLKVKLSLYIYWHLRKNQHKLTILTTILKYFGSHRPWSPHATNKEPRVFFELCPCPYFCSTYLTRSQNRERQFETWEPLSDYNHCHGDCRAPPAPTTRGAQVTELFPYNGKVILGFIFLEREAIEGNFKRHLKGSCNDVENWIWKLVQSP